MALDHHDINIIVIYAASRLKNRLGEVYVDNINSDGMGLKNFFLFFGFGILCHNQFRYDDITRYFFFEPSKMYHQQHRMVILRYMSYFYHFESGLIRL